MESEQRKTIHLCLAKMSQAGLEQKYINKAFDENWVVPMGPNVTEFENLLSQYAGNGKRVVALSSGTAAIHLSLVLLGIGPGDEVCVQDFTFCASSNPVVYVGAKPVYIDSEPDTWNMDADLLEKAIQDRFAATGKYPKAIIPVTLYGMPYRIDRILSVADKYGIPVIEDSAEGFGSSYDGRLMGTFGRYGILSFNGNKMITTSGGGALICRDRADADNTTYYATQARMGYPYYQHEEIGFNYRLSNICAGIGVGQMSVADEHIAHHRHVQKLYEELMADIPGITLHCQPSDGRFESNFWLCTATLDSALRVRGQENAYSQLVTKPVGGAASVLRTVSSSVTECQPNDNVEALRVFLEKKKVETRPVWKPMHVQPVFCAGASEIASKETMPAGVKCIEGPRMVAYVNGVCEDIFRTGICLPSGPCVTDDDVRYIVECIREAIEN